MIALTVSCNPRGSDFIANLQQLVQTLEPTLYRKLRRDIEDIGDIREAYVLNWAATYAFLLSEYLFGRYGLKLTVRSYKEKDSTHRMLNFLVVNINRTNRELEANEESIKIIRDFISKNREPRPRNSIVDSQLKQKGIEMATMSIISGKQVIEAVMNASTAGQKAAATRLQNQYVSQREKDGKSPVMVRAGIKARVARLQNGN
ncbi:unnamed protein product [Sphagnum jensenii]|uniref:Uncharacterized protein n=1 Tax=Sphagnum jensenii TaxID=128206 RepID=A0ABP0VA03_9BRYO